ncbi:MAG: TonB-dependent receptor [Pirellulales bacterium]|nr:TonB-dependent receptor [Pirellulales bacterium]
MRFRLGTAVLMAVMVLNTCSSQATGQMPETNATLVGSTAEENVVDAPDSHGPSSANPVEADDLGLLDLNLGELSKIRVRTGTQPSAFGAPSTEISSADISLSDASTTGGLVSQAPSVNTRRLSAINLDPRVRGYHSGQLNATANGMNEVKTRLDIDSVLSQIDPGIIENVTVIDGPYTSLYGPGFAFLTVDLLPVPRYPHGPSAYADTSFAYGTNGRTLYTRENVLSGGKDWGARFSYGLRTGNDYLTGGGDPFRVPSSYQKWDGLFAVSADLSSISRLEFDYIRCEMDNVELPGVVYDLNNSTNNQFNVKYIVQQDPKGPKDLVIQSWFQHTGYSGDASRTSKQESLYDQFFALPSSLDGYAVNTQGYGFSDSMGARLLRTLGERDSIQWTFGVDWRRYKQYYHEVNLDNTGEIIFGGGDVYGIPHSRMDDFGLLTDLFLPLSDTASINVGGRLDYYNTWLNRNDPVITQFRDPDEAYYAPGLNEPNAWLGMAYITGKNKLSEETTFNTGTAFAMRMPDLTELYSDDPYIPLIRFGNSYCSGLSTLRPEKNLQFDVGITTVKERVSYGARGFYALIWDYVMPVPGFIDFSPPGFIAAPRVLGRDFGYFTPEYRYDLVTGNVNADTNQAGYQYVNVDLAMLGGGDLFAEVQCRDWLSVYGSMAYVCGTNWNPVVYVAADSWVAPEGTLVPTGRREGLPNIYPFNGKLAIRMYDPKRERWLVEFSSRMAASQDNVANSLAEVPTAAFATFTLRGFYQPNENMRLTMAIENLFNTYFVEPGSLAIIGPKGLPVFMPEPGINVVLGVEARF